MFFTTTWRWIRRMLTMIYMTRIQNMSFFLLKVNNPSVHHPVWPHLALRLAPRRAPRLPLSGPPFGPRLVLQ
jgi:hypothetical protein